MVFLLNYEFISKWFDSDSKYELATQLLVRIRNRDLLIIKINK